MTARRTARRSGYTLIELLVASAIATLLMLALYSAFDLTVTQTDIGRERVANTDLARSVINRMSGDLSSSLGLLPPQSGQSDPAAAMSTEGTEETTTTAALLSFQSGVTGDNQQLTLFVSKVPRALLERTTAGATETTTVLPPDLQRVTYYMSPDRGLCRQVRPWITATGTGDSLALDTANEAFEVIAPEVKSVGFEYLNGTGWDASWDGSSAALDDSAMMGPPRAIRVTLVFTILDDNGQATEKTVIHVFPVRASIGNAPTSTGEQP